MRNESAFVKLRTLCLSCLSVALIVGGGAYCTAVGGQESQPSVDLSRWTDHSQAGSKGEGIEYIKAVSETAKALDSLPIDELHARVLPLVDALGEEARWTNFITAMLPVDCIRKLSWQSVLKNDIPHQQVLVGENLGNIKVALDLASRQRLQEAIVQAEHELPIIKQGRITMSENFLVKVLGSSVIRADVSAADEIKEMLKKK
jgi:hypothetical protein